MQLLAKRSAQRMNITNCDLKEISEVREPRINKSASYVQRRGESLPEVKKVFSQRPLQFMPMLRLAS
jgi:hypothetical protein